MWMASAFAFQSVIASARACATKRANPNAVTARILKTLLLFIASSIVFQMACETAQRQALPPKMQSKIIYQCSEYSPADRACCANIFDEAASKYEVDYTSLLPQVIGTRRCSASFPASRNFCNCVGFRMPA